MSSEEAETDDELEDNYYTFLNLPKDATQEQINFAYRKLSRIYHPDKHTDPEHKRKADVLFNRTKRAYEVLSDPQKRAIYDSVGEKGLRTDGWELVYRTKTPAEIRAEYERLAQAAEDRKLQQRTNPKGNVTIHVNATEIFAPYDEEAFPQIEVGSMSISQSIETPLNSRDTLILSGNLNSSNGNGQGAFLICGRRLINRGWLELDIGAGQGPVLAIKGGRTLSSKITINGGISSSFQDGMAIPGLFSTLAVQLDKFTVGTLSLNVGAQSSSLTTQVDYAREKYAFSAAIVLGTPHIYLNLSYMRKMFLENELKLRISAKVGTFGFMTEYGAEKRVSKYSSLVASVSVGMPTGVILKFKVLRANQSYIFPIHLSEEIVPAAVFYASVVPVVAWYFVKKSLLDPMEEERKRKEIERAKRNNEQKIKAKQEEAFAAIELMRPTYQRLLQEELERGGLVVSKGTYGVLKNADDIDFLSDASVDVTIPLQCLVRSSVLQLHEGTKSELPGFYDPCIGIDKVLRIEYQFNNQINIVVIKDLEALRLPSLNTTTTAASSPPSAS